MKCFKFAIVDKAEEPKTSKSNLSSSTASGSTDNGRKGSCSEFSLQNVSDTSIKSSTRISFASLSHRSKNLRVFTVEELKAATTNFSRSLMIGEGGFGGVYRGSFRENECRIDIAVKQLSTRGLQGHKEWVTEVNVLGVVEHPNLVNLIGYGAEDDERGIQRLLVYEYLHNRSVLDHLSSRSQATLPWSTRMKIAQDAACGLAYLHEGMDFQIIFRDFKSSNILLDDRWNAKLSDFGLARLGPSDGLGHISTSVRLFNDKTDFHLMYKQGVIFFNNQSIVTLVVGTIGYAAPEYVQTGRLTSKSDVWSYGVFLYELITGRRPVDRNRPKNDQKLLDWVKQHISNGINKFEQILDPRLEGKFDLRSALKLAAIANMCLVRNPKNRPRMSHVVEMVSIITEGNGSSSPENFEKILTPKNDTVASYSGNLRRVVSDHIIGFNKRLLWRTCSKPNGIATI